MAIFFFFFSSICFLQKLSSKSVRKADKKVVFVVFGWYADRGDIFMDAMLVANVGPQPPVHLPTRHIVCDLQRMERGTS